MMGAKISQVQVRWETHYLHGFKVSPDKILTNNKEKNSNFTVGKLARHQVDLHQVIKVDIFRDGTNQHHVPPDPMHWGGHNSSLFLVTAERDMVQQWGSLPGSAILSMPSPEYRSQLVLLFLQARLIRSAPTLHIKRSCQNFLQQSWSDSSPPWPPGTAGEYPLSLANIHRYNLQNPWCRS